MGRIRSVAVAAGIAAAMVTLSGCIAVTEGLVGLTVDETGTTVLLLAPCTGPSIQGTVTDVTLFAGSSRSPIPEAEGRILSAVDHPVELAIDLDLEPSTEYQIWANIAKPLLKDSNGLWSVWFTKEDLASLKPGIVLHSQIGQGGLVSFEKFEQLACEQFADPT